MIQEKVEELSELLREKGLMLASAESCTGGMIAAAMTDLAGSSDVFERGFVTYSNKAKQEMLGVNPATLNQHGAVSEAVAREMAFGAVENSMANIAVSITGIAGPSGGTQEKPVGLVYIAICVQGGKQNAVQCNFSGDRKDVRLSTCSKAFDLLIEAVRTI
jgi:nicotinamide-nucleotide amidase